MAPRTRHGTSAEPQKRSIRLTVKPAPSRLQEIKGDEEEATRPARGRSGRASRQKQSYVEKATSEEEDEDEEDEDDDGAEQEDDEDQDAEGDEDDEEVEEDGEGDIDMDDVPPPPAPKSSASKPTIKISASSSTKPGKARKSSPSTHLNLSSTKHRSVEEKETGNAASQSESSEVEDDPEGLENGALDEPEDDLDHDRGDTIKVDAVNESDLDSDDSNDSSLPDLSKLTRRQRGGVDEGSLMALSNEAQKKKFFTPEQITMRRAEMARRRKDLSEKRNEQEKADTLRRLLQKPAPTRRSRAQVLADAEREEFGLGRAGLRGESVVGDEDDGEREENVNRIYTRTVVTRNGSRVGVPADWLDGPAGKPFEGVTNNGKGWDQVIRSGRMVEEVQ